MRGAVIVAGYAMQESVRRRVFPVVLVLTGAFLGLYVQDEGVNFFEEAGPFV